MDFTPDLSVNRALRARWRTGDNRQFESPILRHAFGADPRWALGGFLIAVAVAVDLLTDGVADGLIALVMVLGLVIGVVHVVRHRRPQSPE